MVPTLEETVKPSPAMMEFVNILEQTRPKPRDKYILVGLLATGLTLAGIGAYLITQPPSQSDCYQMCAPYCPQSIPPNESPSNYSVDK